MFGENKSKYLSYTASEIGNEEYCVCLSVTAILNCFFGATSRTEQRRWGDSNSLGSCIHVHVSWSAPVEATY